MVALPTMHRVSLRPPTGQRLAGGGPRALAGALLVLPWLASTTAAAPTSNTFTLSAHLAGTLTPNASKSCVAGNIFALPGLTGLAPCVLTSSPAGSGHGPSGGGVRARRGALDLEDRQSELGLDVICEPLGFSPAGFVAAHHHDLGG